MDENSFYNLTPDEILRSVDTTGRETSGHYIPLNSLENRVYRIGLENGSAIVVKFYRPGRWTPEEIQEEHDFLYELSESGVPVLTPLQEPSGQSIYKTDSGILFTLWPLFPGRIVEELKDEDLPVLGRWLAQIHNIGAASPIKTRVRMDIDSYARPAMELILAGSWMNTHTETRYRNICEKIFSVYSALSDSVPFHRIHGDCHKGNLLQTQEQFYFLDFDDFLEGPPTQDFWMFLPYGESNSEYQRSLFLDGYMEFRNYSPAWDQLVEPLRAIRYIYYSGWIAKRWSDPAFPNIFPHFGGEAYWEREIRDLEDLFYSRLSGFE
jgi:Ser/Thr protein kinase RdoA (MazF antagonist)